MPWKCRHGRRQPPWRHERTYFSLPLARERHPKPVGVQLYPPCALSRHPGRGRREAPRRKQNVRLPRSQPPGGVSEGGEEVLIALVELAADLPARRVEQRRG